MEDCQHLDSGGRPERPIGRFALPMRGLSAVGAWLKLAGLARAAVATADARALAAVIRRLHELESNEADAFAKSRGPFNEAIRCVLTRPIETAVVNAVDVIIFRRDPALLDHLVALLDDEHPAIVDRAAGALLEVVVGRLGETGRRRVHASAAERIDRAIAGAGHRFRSHRRDEILIAAAIGAIRPGPALQAILDENDHPLTIALRGVADRFDRPIVQRNLIRWLETPAVRSSVERAFHRLTGRAATVEALRDGHLLRSRSRGPALRRLARPIRCLPDPAAMGGLPIRAQIHLPALIARLDVSAPTRVDRLASLCASPSSIVRLRALETLLALGDRRARPIIERCCLDDERAIAHLAAQHLEQGADRDRSVIERIAESRHPAVALRARASLSRTSAAEFSNRVVHLSRNHRSAASLELSRSDPGGLVDALRCNLRVEDPRRCIAAIMLARRRRLVPEVEGEILALAQRASPHLASAAIAALAEGASSDRLVVLREALDHRDHRVQANAIEALARSAENPDREAIRRFVRVRRNRPRANAVRATLTDHLPGALGELKEMLTDADPLHRVSAIWAVRAAEAREAAGTLARLAGEDEHPEIRTRARAALRFLSAHAAHAAGNEVTA
jgi:HEAT repeat protein